MPLGETLAILLARVLLALLRLRPFDCRRKQHNQSQRGREAKMAYHRRQQEWAESAQAAQRAVAAGWEVAPELARSPCPRRRRLRCPDWTRRPGDGGCPRAHRRCPCRHRHRRPLAQRPRRCHCPTHCCRSKPTRACEPAGTESHRPLARQPGSQSAPREVFRAAPVNRHPAAGCPQWRQRRPQQPRPRCESP